MCTIDDFDKRDFITRFNKALSELSVSETHIDEYTPDTMGVCARPAPEEKHEYCEELYIPPQVRTQPYYVPEETHISYIGEKCTTMGARARYALEHMSACPEEKKYEHPYKGRYRCLAMEEVERTKWLDKEMTFLSEEQILLDEEFDQLILMYNHLIDKQKTQDKQRLTLNAMISYNKTLQEMEGS
jgi:hypothetical protein